MTQMNDWIRDIEYNKIQKWILWTYICIQSSIAIAISIFGALYVRQCFQSDTDDKRCGYFGKVWAKIVWKMRGVYSALVVHCFDVLTDILVIIEWLYLPNQSGDNINPQYMAYSAIAVLFVARIVSTIAIYIKERNIFRSLLQFVDLLIFQEIFEAHNKIKMQFRKEGLINQTNAIESTLSFKYVRQMEAVFESIPQSILQLVYVMRISTIQPLFVLSIAQSIISMTNSVLNHDYIQMQQDEFKPYKQRLPPTAKFFSHAVCRFSEITYRTGLLALIWTVCEGEIFTIICCTEVLIIIVRTLVLVNMRIVDLNANTILLAINSFVVIPSENVYGSPSYEVEDLCYTLDSTNFCAMLLVSCCCYLTCLGTIAWVASMFKSRQNFNMIPLSRMWISFVEFIFMIVWAIQWNNGERFEFLFSFEHGLSVLIVSFVFFLIYTQYSLLFPDFSLPFGIPVRSKWGYAYTGELGELKKIKLPKFPYSYRRVNVEITINNPSEFWDEVWETSEATTAATVAKDLGYTEIVDWLEEQGARRHIKTAFSTGNVFEDAFETHIKQNKPIVHMLIKIEYDGQIAQNHFKLPNNKTVYDVMKMIENTSGI
eukprot:358948_1